MPSHPSQPPRVTVREIAKKLGLHFSTVSLALRNSPRLLPATRERVQDFAREIGYRPDPMLAALNVYRLSKEEPRYQATIGWLNNWPDRAKLLENREFKEYYQGACERAAELGYTVEEFWLHEPGMSPERLHRIFKARNIQALLFPPQPEWSTPLNLDFSDYSSVAFGHSMQPSVLHLVTNHHFHSMNLVLSHVYEYGYRRVALFCGTDWNKKVGEAWMGGALTSQQKYPSLKIFSPMLSKRSEPRLDLWLEKVQPDVIISYSDIIHEVREFGYKIPKEVGFASLGLAKEDHEISGIYQGDHSIGRKAVDILVGMVQQGERGLPEIQICTFVEGVWREGTTLRKQKKAGVR